MATIPVSFLWLIAGALFVAMEAFGISGIGFLFAGLGALGAGIAIEMGLAHPESYVTQFAWFFGLSTLAAAMLWKPLRRFQKQKPGYSNMVGETAVLEGPLAKGQTGSARWSGTIMQAELSPDSAASDIPGGSKVRILDVKGATLIVDRI